MKSTTDTGDLVIDAQVVSTTPTVTLSDNTAAAVSLTSHVDSFRDGVMAQAVEVADFSTKNWQRTWRMIERACQIMLPYVYGPLEKQAELAALYSEAQITAPAPHENPCHAACALLWGHFHETEKTEFAGVARKLFVRNRSAEKYAHVMRRAYQLNIPLDGIYDWIAATEGKLKQIEADDRAANPFRPTDTEDSRILEQLMHDQLQAGVSLPEAGSDLEHQAKQAGLAEASFARAVMQKRDDGVWVVVSFVPNSDKLAKSDIEQIAKRRLREIERQQVIAEREAAKQAKHDKVKENVKKAEAAKQKLIDAYNARLAEQAGR
ncbi:hypothetical protein JYK14_01170 [Siccirubricoccus sp. KC 17139]|uniref:Uncharacterized protein n=1 Tax=Siccirubricoccus soli TaxID=2899147 RepID=A0ABT1CYP9_9PROT|nr:hypothetical protein [Siccirubricoccus soli]MCO6414791.1 hypothetical protein [Siccirubricoccus soli]MCP2680921.1 hypothetical protein [Siccirubricoccus soli]